MKLLILLLVAFGAVYRLTLNWVQARSCSNPIPQNVSDVYDSETYDRWRRYSGEHSRLEFVSTVLSFLVSLLLLVTNAYAAMAACFAGNYVRQVLAVVLLDTLASWLISFGIRYYGTMVIEEKYGFNRSTMKTFLFDRFRSLIFESLLAVGLAWLLMQLHLKYGDGMILFFAAALFFISFGAAFLHPIFSRIGNKFVPLEDGELKDQLVALLRKHGYRVKAIQVMDASRRTTKLNAYFTGFGKLKTIVLYDNLVNAMTTDEICAVFAHELGHGLHKDILKMQVMNFGNLLLMAVVVWLAARTHSLYAAFGFEIVNYGFAYVLAGIGLGMVQPVSSMVMNGYSRRAEFRADRQAVEEGYAEAMVTAMKKLAKENFAHLAPSPVNVVLQYSHPPMSQRIARIEETVTKE